MNILARLAVAAGALLASCLGAGAQGVPTTRDALALEINTQLPSCGTNCISAAVLRQVLLDMVASVSAIYHDAAVTLTGSLIVGTPGGSVSAGSVNVSGNYYINGSAAGLRGGNPRNLYVSLAGNDSNACLTIITACHTIQHAVNLAQTYDLGGQDLIINLAAGTYVESVRVNGAPIGQSNISASIVILGHGSSSTIVDPSTNCGAGASPIIVGYYAILKIGSVKLTTSCPGGSDLNIAFFSHVQLYDGDVNFGAAAADGNLIALTNHSNFLAGSFPITISGGAAIGFYISTLSTAVTGVGVTNIITGNPTIGVFVDAFVGSAFNMGSSSSWSGTIIGTRYALALNSTIDTEQQLAPLPGTIPGTVASGSFYYSNLTIACVGGAVGCRNATAPTGLGSGGTAVIGAGSGDHGGTVVITAGSGSASSGTFRVAQGSLLDGDTGNGGYCVAGLSQAGGLSWGAGATINAFYDFASTGTIVFVWNNNGVALSNGTNYTIGYVCQ